MISDIDNRPEHALGLSLATCRRLLGASGAGLSDTELTRLRQQMYELARCTVVAYEGERDTEQETAALAQIRGEERDEIEERAAVLQFDAKMTRRAATKAALASHRSSRQRKCTARTK